MADDNAAGVNPTIVVPGIKGSTLMNSYPMTPSTTWNTWQAIAGTPLESIQLDKLGQVDFGDEVVNRAVEMLHPAYEKLVSGLRGRLKSPVYAFPYDWRLSCKTNAQRLVAFVKEIQAKPMTSLPGWSKGKRLVNLVCHSMGGLVARSFLAQWSDGAPPVDGLVFIATPHFGSLDAVAAIITGDTPVLDFEKRLRKLARAMPSVYELLPHDWDDAPVVLGGKPLDLFQEGNWQSNVIEETDGLEDLTPGTTHRRGRLLRVTPFGSSGARLGQADPLRGGEQAEVDLGAGDRGAHGEGRRHHHRELVPLRRGRRPRAGTGAGRRRPGGDRGVSHAPQHRAQGRSFLRRRLVAERARGAAGQLPRLHLQPRRGADVGGRLPQRPHHR